MSCAGDDTEEIFWLRQTDDVQSKVRLGTLLSRQYRFASACEAFEEAIRLNPQDAMNYVRLGGAQLTLFRFEQANAAYQKAEILGIAAQHTAYPMGLWHYLRGEYAQAQACFLQCMPCDDELGIAMIYWETLAALRSHLPSELLKRYHPQMRVGHHTAYQLAVRLLRGEIPIQAYMEALDSIQDDLSFVTAGYAGAVFMYTHDLPEQALHLRSRILERTSVWPSVSFLACVCDPFNG